MFKKPLFIFELANNHSGDVKLAKRIISELKDICVYDEFDYAVKLQYRDLDTFIAPDAKRSSDNLAVQRFLSTELTLAQFKDIRDCIGENGFKAVCTPFDEKSVSLIIEHNYDYIKVASCSFTDWPLLEEIVKADMPIIASTAASTLEEIGCVTQFLSNRNKQFALMHCIGEYPTAISNLQMNQISLLKSLYPEVPIGYSTHESPNENFSISLAVAKGACIYEKHVGISTDAVKLNAYSATPEQASLWLESAHKAYLACGIDGQRHSFSDKEMSDLWNFRRGVFARNDIKTGSVISSEAVYYAIPKTTNQLTANDMSKYIRYTATSDIATGEAVCDAKVSLVNVREMTETAYRNVKKMLEDSGVALGKEGVYELSHHYGIDKFEKYGCSMVEVINRAYCKKIIVLLPGQENPTHTHKVKEESFHVLYGSIDITIDGECKTYQTGEVVHISPNQKHSFSSAEGCVVEEVSTTHHKGDSYYDDEKITSNKNRKTVIQYY
ncbi:MAG: N-acetylneuraminate synthase family protein [Oscillospiraceae bacterium]|nr:N-acetylneuraminate synthase family protein [Oscillospiraceae bacterium]